MTYDLGLIIATTNHKTLLTKTVEILQFFLVFTGWLLKWVKFQQKS
jgi:hypothetical protein